jgi:hypothetical protein
LYQGCPRKCRFHGLLSDVKELEVGARFEDGVADIEKIPDLDVVAELQVVLDGIGITYYVNYRILGSEFA